MAFGAKSKSLADNKGTSGTGNDGEQKVFESPHMPIGSGTRIFRVLPEMKDGEVVLTERLGPNNKPLREGGKKDGAILYGPNPEEEVAFLFAWWEVMVNGEKKPRRLILNIDDRWTNPLWKHIEKNWPQKKGEKNNAKERKAIKQGFAINVYDVSPVKRNDAGQLFYQSEANEWNLLAYGNAGKLLDLKDDKVPAKTVEAEPLNQVRILEGSYGSLPGGHLFAQLADNVDQVEDTDGMIRRLPEFDLKLRTVGKELDTKRTIRNTNNFKPLPAEVVKAARYDLKSWLTPWPDAAIEELIDGEDYNEVVEKYEIQLFPKLYAVTGESVVEEEEEGLFDS